MLFACIVFPLETSCTFSLLLSLLLFSLLFVLITSNKQLCIMSGTQSPLSYVGLVSGRARAGSGLAKSAIDPLCVMMAERLPASEPDLCTAAGLREPWIAIDFYLIQSFHSDSNLLPGGGRQSLQRSFNSCPGPSSQAPHSLHAPQSCQVKTYCCSGYYCQTY